MMRVRQFTMDAAKNPSKSGAGAGVKEGLPPVAEVYERGVQEIVAGRLTLIVAVADVAKNYELDPGEVRAEFDRLLAEHEAAEAEKPEDKGDAARKKKRAAKLEAEAVEAEAFAAEAATKAKEARMVAEAAKADAENRVLVNVPTSFFLNIRRPNGTVDTIQIKAGSTSLPREHAEHSYAKAHGVQILGLPGEEKAAA